MSVRIKGSRGILLCIVLVVATITSVFQSMNVNAANITTRKLELQAGTGGTFDGGSKPLGVVNHLFTFTVPTTANIGSIKFQYCTTASDTCTTPDQIVTTAATDGGETGATGFTLNNAVNGSPYLHRTAESIAATTVVSYRLNGVTNPSATIPTFFVRISTYNSVDTSGSAIDSGTVAASTATQIVLNGTMPESLIFCTGATVGLSAGLVPDCSTATPGVVKFNQLFSPTDTATATSQMAASTNATGGFVIGVSGKTLTNGIYTIAPMTTRALGTRGKSQFGMNLKLNTATTSSPAVGLEIAPIPGAGFKGQAAAGFDTQDEFKFEEAPTFINTVANSANGGAGPTNAQIYTASYIVNVPGSQTAGLYTTTLTYICTATF